MNKLIDIIKKSAFLFLDALFVLMSFMFVIFILKDNYIYFLTSEKLFPYISLCACIYVTVIYLTNGYRCIWSYAEVSDFFYVIAGAFLASSVVIAVSIGIRDRIIDMRTLFLTMMVASCVVIGFRAFIKLVYYFNSARKGTNASDSKNLLIVGAGKGASLIIKELHRHDSDYEIVGAVDDNVSKIGRAIAGVNIYGDRHDIPELCRKYDVDEILIAIPSISGDNKKEILQICSRTGCKVKIMPDSLSLLSSPGYKMKMRDVQLEDLLARDVIKLTHHNIDMYLKDKVVMVTGGGGSIGSELCRQIARKKPALLIIFDIYENNAYDIQNELRYDYPELKMEVLIGSVRDRVRLEQVFAEHTPEIVFHAAAHKHVPLMERSPGETIKNNICGTLNVCECADKFGVKRFVLISTDKAVNPTNIMGASKRICEMIVQSINRKSKTEFVAVRFGNVLGSNGSVIPLFKKQIERGGPVTLTHKEITRYFMTIPEAAQLVLEAGGFAKGGEIFVLDMGQPVRIYDLAVNLIEQSGYTVGKDIEIKITGLRPGEKLYEELLMGEEGLTATLNDKIFVARPGNYEFDNVKSDIDRLLALADSENIENIRKGMQEIVPEYSGA